MDVRSSLLNPQYIMQFVRNALKDITFKFHLVPVSTMKLNAYGMKGDTPAAINTVKSSKTIIT